MGQCKWETSIGSMNILFRLSRQGVKQVNKMLCYIWQQDNLLHCKTYISKCKGDPIYGYSQAKRTTLMLNRFTLAMTF